MEVTLNADEKDEVPFSTALERKMWIVPACRVGRNDIKNKQIKILYGLYVDFDLRCNLSLVRAVDLFRYFLCNGGVSVSDCTAHSGRHYI